jgi:hypothetical protein
MRHGQEESRAGMGIAFLNASISTGKSTLPGDGAFLPAAPVRPT